MEKTRDIKSLMQICLDEAKLKKYRQDISKIVPAVIKDPSKIPLVITNQEKELKKLNSSLENLKNTFKCEVIVETAEKSKEQKAKNASPSKPAIVIQ